MPTTNPRINITLDGETAAMLAFLAKRKSQSKSALAREYILMAMEMDEDKELSRLATKRMQTMTKTISAQDVWGQD